MTLHRIHGIDRRSTPTDLAPVGEAATGPARHPGGPGRTSLLRIRGLERPRRAGRTRWRVMNLLRIRGLDRPRRAGRTRWHVDREV